MTARAADEAPHVPASTPGWSDAWQFDAANGDGVGLTVRLALFADHAWFWAYLVLPALTGPVVVRDHDVPRPRQGLEIRAEGLWSELWCETPLDHWTCGLEAFAVRLDDPDDALAGEIGERVPFGLDVEWEARGALHPYPERWPVAGYVIPGIVHGDVLLGRERFELDAPGEYRRSWGAHDEIAWVRHGAGDFTFHQEGTTDGRVDGFGPDDLAVDVLARAPVPLPDRSVDRALCRFRSPAGTAYGWAETAR